MRDESVNGIDFDDDDHQIRRCEVCSKGKQKRDPFPSSNSKTNSVLELVHSDIMGPMQTKSFGDARYILTFVDDFTRKLFIYFVKRKDTSEVFDAFIHFKAMAENYTDKKIKIIRTDGGGNIATKYLIARVVASESNTK